MSGKLIQSYVWHEGRRFYVSTINRESSALAAYGRIYAETMAWEWPADSARGELIGQGEAGSGSFREHERACRCLHETGQYQPKEED